MNISTTANIGSDLAVYISDIKREQKSLKIELFFMIMIISASLLFVALLLNGGSPVTISEIFQNSPETATLGFLNAN